MPAATERISVKRNGPVKPLNRIGVPAAEIDQDPRFRRGIPVIVSQVPGKTVTQRLATDAGMVYQITELAGGRQPKIEMVRVLTPISATESE